MEVDKKLITHVADVARLKLTEEEIDKFLPQLQEILAAFQKIDEIDTSGIEPSFQPVEIKNVTREDTPSKTLTQEQALKNSTHKEDGYFKGPKAV